VTLPEDIRRADPASVALDVEGDSFYRYGERLCLVQIAYAGRVAIADPCSDDLAPLLAEIANRELILHGADFDIRLLHARYGFRPDEVFDTMLAARFLSYPKFGLSDLYERHFGIVLEKKFQRADWCRRPLSEQLLQYARKDVEHLEELAGRLRAELTAAGRLEWHREECRSLVQKTIENVRRPPDAESWRVKGSGSLNRRELAFLRELAGERDRLARDADRALFRICSTEDLLQLARLAAREPGSALSRFSRPLPGRLLQAFGAAVRRAADQDPASDPERPPAGRRPSPVELRRAAEIEKARDAVAERTGLDPGFLLSRAAIGRLALDPPDDLDGLAERIGSRWRAGLFEEIAASPR